MSKHTKVDTIVRMGLSEMFRNSSSANLARLWPGFLLASLASSALILICCGKDSKTASPGGSRVEGVPADWDGQTDYDHGGWRFEAP